MERFIIYDTMSLNVANVESLGTVEHLAWKKNCTLYINYDATTTTASSLLRIT